MENDRDIILIVEDEADSAVFIQGIVNTVFPGHPLIFKETVRDALQVIDAQRDQILLVITDGILSDDNLEREITGEKISERAVNEGIPHVVFYAGQNPRVPLLTEVKTLLKARNNLGDVLREMV